MKILTLILILLTFSFQAYAIKPNSITINKLSKIIQNVKSKKQLCLSIFEDSSACQSRALLNQKYLISEVMKIKYDNRLLPVAITVQVEDSTLNQMCEVKMRHSLRNYQAQGKNLGRMVSYSSNFSATGWEVTNISCKY